MSATMPESADRELVLRRELPFPRALVWKAWIDPEHVEKWWGPDGFRTEGIKMDFRIGGAWTFDMVGPDGTRYPNRMVFTEITPPAKLVCDQGDGKTVWFQSVVTFEETRTGTLITLRLIFPNRDSRDEVVTKYGAVEGGIQHLAKLEAFIRTRLS